MRPRDVIAFALLIACMASSMAAWAASSDSPLPPPAPLASLHGVAIGKFESRLIPVHDDLIARVYAQALRERFVQEAIDEKRLLEPLDEDEAAPDEIAIDEAAVEVRVRQTLAASSAGGEPHYPEATVTAGEYAGQWTFADHRDGAPTRAWRDIDRSGAGPYDAERLGYCRGDEKSCEVWFEEGRHRAPEPNDFRSTRAKHEWENRVMREPCTPGPEYRPGLESLQRAITDSGRTEAQLEMGLLLNPCGEVREAFFLKSSRDRAIDRAALRWVEQARFVSMVQTTGGGYGMRGRLPFVFSTKP